MGVDEHFCDTLHHASKIGHNKCIIRLSEQGISSNEKDEGGYTPLHSLSQFFIIIRISSHMNV